MRQVTLHPDENCKVVVYLGGKCAGINEEVFGCCCTYEVGSGYMIEIQMRADVVSEIVHEFVHAACSIMRLFYYVPADFFDFEFFHEDEGAVGPEECPEERLAYLVGSMSNEFWGEFYKRGYDKLLEFAG